MANFELLKDLIQPAKTKIVLLVMDGLGGLPRPSDDKTELEAANTPNLDKLAQEGCLGQHYPVEIGITSGSGPGHLGLFGYDPIKYEIGRGVLEAVGINFVSSSDKAALIARLTECDDMDYFERGIELMIEADGVRVLPLDITEFFAVEVDFEEDLSRANAHL